MADDLSFSNEPKLPGAKEPKPPRAPRRTPKALGPAPLATPPSPTVAERPARVASIPWESDVSPARVVTPLPPEANTPAPPATSAPTISGLAHVPLFVIIAGLPFFAVVYGIRTLVLARNGAPVNKVAGIVALSLGGAVILGVIGVFAATILEPGEERDPLDLVVGDCVTDKGLAGEDPEDVPSVQVIACEDPHFGQVFYVSSLTEYPYPGESEVISRVDKACSAETDRVSLEASDPEGYLNFLFPSKDMWLEGDKRFMCLVTASGEDRFVGSVLAP